ncbi:uncharacterized protein LOC109859310 [Pseudomyrmex gracilis]|uniref:uncharacterized protein LOC109859310 n=1 Tax=Pseudomyrmex gracilis TaxID=219809 RepID=UPI0009954B12|nr:uncharacterized protein LOC109859310 [Pseudomyrmex gracilis]
MDEEQTENTISMDCSDNVAIPAMTANLETLTIETNSLPTDSKRLLRKRKPRELSITIRNRRCSLKPKQRMSSKTDEEIIKDYYLDKNIKRKANALETIYEESDNIDDDNLINMSTKRFKRMLMFPREVTASKLKKRHARVRKVFGSKIKYKRCGNMQTLVDKLSTIRENSPMKIDSELK